VTLDHIPTPTKSHTALLAAKTNNNYYAILDSSTTDTYLTKEAPTLRKTVDHEKILVTTPDGNRLVSPHKSKLNLPLLPPTACEGYTIPGLKNHSLFLVNKLCTAGCKVLFSKEECIVIYKGNEVTRGIKNKHNGLWYVPLTPTDNHQSIIRGELR
jgi:hypothetical protein